MVLSKSTHGMTFDSVHPEELYDGVKPNKDLPCKISHVDSTEAVDTDAMATSVIPRVGDFVVTVQHLRDKKKTGGRHISPQTLLGEHVQFPLLLTVLRQRSALLPGLAAAAQAIRPVDQAEVGKATARTPKRSKSKSKRRRDRVADTPAGTAGDTSSPAVHKGKVQSKASKARRIDVDVQQASENVAAAPAGAMHGGGVGIGDGGGAGAAPGPLARLSCKSNGKKAKKQEQPSVSNKKQRSL
jgi:hypothetical protein